MRERILAIVGALALIGLAVFVRGLLIDKNDGGSGKGSGGKGTTDLAVVACTPDLATICAALAADGEIADDPPSLDLDKAGTPSDIKDIDGWITWSPAPTIAEIDAGSRTTWGKETVLGSAPLAVLADPSTLDCGEPVEWSCLATKAGQDYPVGVGRVDTAEGLARLAPFAPSLARDGDSTLVDVNLGRELLDGPQLAQDDALSMLRLAATPGFLSAVVAPAPLTNRFAATTQAKARNLRSVAGAPATRVAVVLVGRNKSLDDVAKATERGDAAATLAERGLDRSGDAPDIDPGALWQLRKQLR